MNILRQKQIECHVDTLSIRFQYDDNRPAAGLWLYAFAEDGRGEGRRRYDPRDARRSPFRSGQQLQPVAPSKGR